MMIFIELQSFPCPSNMLHESCHALNLLAGANERSDGGNAVTAHEVIACFSPALFVPEPPGSIRRACCP
jgi:hypothetical protein